MKINMFDIFYADLSKNAINSEQGGVRPVIIIQNDVGNKYSPTVLVLPMTKEIKKVNMPTHCIIRRSSKNGLNVDSMVLAEQIRVIDKSRLLDKLGHLDNIKEQNAVISAYIANIIGQKNYTSIWSKLINVICRLIKEDDYGNAA